MTTKSLQNLRIAFFALLNFLAGSIRYANTDGDLPIVRVEYCCGAVIVEIHLFTHCRLYSHRADALRGHSSKVEGRRTQDNNAEMKRKEQK